MCQHSSGQNSSPSPPGAIFWLYCRRHRRCRGFMENPAWSEKPLTGSHVLSHPHRPSKAAGLCRAELHSRISCQLLLKRSFWCLRERDVLMYQWEQKKNNFYPLAVSTTLIVQQREVGLGPIPLCQGFRTLWLGLRWGESWQENEHKFHCHISEFSEHPHFQTLHLCVKCYSPIFLPSFIFIFQDMAGILQLLLLPGVGIFVQKHPSCKKTVGFSESQKKALGKGKVIWREADQHRCRLLRKGNFLNLMGFVCVLCG